MSLWLVLALAARGDGDVASWTALHDAMLLESAFGDTRSAITAYERLVRELPGGAPLRTEALFRLGEGRRLLGDVEGAREALREGVRTGCPRDRCLDLLTRIDLNELAVTAIPTRWTFDDGAHGFVYAGRQTEGGSIRVRQDAPVGNAALEWTRMAVPGSEDQLAVGFRDPRPAPRGVRLTLLSLNLDAQIRLLAQDASGRRCALLADPSVLDLPRGTPVMVDARFSDATCLDPRPRTFEPAALERLVIQDITGWHGEFGGANAILIDDFEVY